MARTNQTRKRSRPLSFGGTKPAKRRFTRKRRATRSKNFTSQKGSGSGLTFRSKKTTRSKYKRMLWDSTSMKEHYRSCVCAADTFLTPATTTAMTVISQASLRFVANPFYTAAGGAISPDSAQALPLFTGDVIIRGGMIGLRLTNTFDSAAPANNTLQGVVFLVRTTKNYTPAALPATIPVGWDPTLVQDFNTKIGRIVYRKSFLLRDTDSANIEYRLRLRKVDVGDYVNEFNELIWIVIGGNVDVSTARVMNVQYYYNLSFSADAV